MKFLCLPGAVLLAAGAVFAQTPTRPNWPCWPWRERRFCCSRRLMPQCAT